MNIKVVFFLTTFIKKIAMKAKTNSAKGIQKRIAKKDKPYGGFDSAIINLGIKIIPFSETDKINSK